MVTVRLGLVRRWIFLSTTSLVSLAALSKVTQARRDEWSVRAVSAGLSRYYARVDSNSSNTSSPGSDQGNQKMSRLVGAIFQWTTNRLTVRAQQRDLLVAHLFPVLHDALWTSVHSPDQGPVLRQRLSLFLPLVATVCFRQPEARAQVAPHWCPLLDASSVRLFQLSSSIDKRRESVHSEACSTDQADQRPTDRPTAVRPANEDVAEDTAVLTHIARALRSVCLGGGLGALEACRHGVLTTIHRLVAETSVRDDSLPANSARYHLLAALADLLDNALVVDVLFSPQADNMLSLKGRSVTVNADKRISDPSVTPSSADVLHDVRLLWPRSPPPPPPTSVVRAVTTLVAASPGSWANPEETRSISDVRSWVIPILVNEVLSGAAPLPGGERSSSGTGSLLVETLRPTAIASAKALIGLAVACHDCRSPLIMEDVGSSTSSSRSIIVPADKTHQQERLRQALHIASQIVAEQAHDSDLMTVSAFTASALDSTAQHSFADDQGRTVLNEAFEPVDQT